MYRERHPYRYGQVILRICACPSGVGTYTYIICLVDIVCAAGCSVHKVGGGGGGGGSLLKLLL